MNENIVKNMFLLSGVFFALGYLLLAEPNINWLIYWGLALSGIVVNTLSSELWHCVGEFTTKDNSTDADGGAE